MHSEKHTFFAPLQKNERASLDEMTAAFTTKFNKWLLHGIKKLWGSCTKS
jgi:hypothetical protein